MNESIGTLSIDDEIHDDDVCNPRRIGSKLSFSAGKTKVKVPLRRKSHLFKLTFLGSKLVFRLKTSRKNVIQTNLTKKVP